MKRNMALVLLIIATVVCIVCCKNDVVQTGSLLVEIDSSFSRGLQAISMETTSYNVIIRNSSNEIVLDKSSSTQTSYSISVPVGTYTVAVEALNKDGIVIGTGSTTGLVSAGQTNTFTVTVSELSGNGTFSISITANEGYELSYSIKNAVGSEIKNGALVFAEGKYSTSMSLENGFYSFSVIRTDTNTVLKIDSLRVIKDKSVEYRGTFTFLSDGSVIINDLIAKTPSIELNASSKYPRVGDTLSVSATIGNIDSYTCYWALDGVALSEAKAYENLELEITESLLGQHEIALFVTDGEVIWSGSTVFNVTVFTITSEGILGVYNKSLLSSNLSIPREVNGVIVKSIGECAFLGCTLLTEVSIPDSVEDIDGWAFRDCSGLTKITIPDSVTHIGDIAFGGCSSLTDIIIDSSNENFISENGVLFDRGKETLLAYPSASGSVSIPTTVTRIGEGAFLDCKGLTEIVIPDSVTEIGQNAFYHCYGLTEVNIPNSVINLEFGAFNGCHNLSCIFLPDSLTSIGKSAFYGCWSLNDISIPASVSSIGEGVFGDCNSLVDIIVSSSNSAYCSENGALFDKEKKTLLAYPGASGSVTIIDSVTSIENCAFLQCSNLTEISIPESVTCIGNEAFWDCSSLTKVYLPDSIKSIGDEAFYGCSSLERIEFGGTQSQWDSISKGKDWNLDVDNSCLIVFADANNNLNGFWSVQGITLPEDWYVDV